MPAFAPPVSAAGCDVPGQTKQTFLKKQFPLFVIQQGPLLGFAGLRQCKVIFYFAINSGGFWPHLEFSSVSSSNSNGCSIQYLFCKELETLIFTNTFIGFSKHRIKWFTSSSVVTGCIGRHCKGSYVHLGSTYLGLRLINLQQTKKKKKRKKASLILILYFCLHLQTTNMHASCKLSPSSHIRGLFNFQSHSIGQG